MIVFMVCVVVWGCGWGCCYCVDVLHIVHVLSAWLESVYRGAAGSGNAGHGWCLCTLVCRGIAYCVVTWHVLYLFAVNFVRCGLRHIVQCGACLCCVWPARAGWCCVVSIMYSHMLGCDVCCVLFGLRCGGLGDNR